MDGGSNICSSKQKYGHTSWNHLQRAKTSHLDGNPRKENVIRKKEQSEEFLKQGSKFLQGLM